MVRGPPDWGALPRSAGTQPQIHGRALLTYPSLLDAGLNFASSDKRRSAEQMESAIVSLARVRLLEADRDLGQLLTREELVEARQLAIPVLTINRHHRDLAPLDEGDVFGALILEGIALRQLRVVDQIGMQLLGPGDLIPLRGTPPPMVVAEASLEAVAETRLALLGREIMFATRRWPSLVAALHLRASQQADRLAAQLVICQLPRVDQRLLSLLWLLAESWGRVTPAGTALPLRLTHEALGALIGARRPTVTLALRDLAERGAIIRQNEGWLLLDPPPAPSGQAEPVRIPGLIGEEGSSPWADIQDTEVASLAATAAVNTASYALLKEALDELRERHVHARDRFDERLREFERTRERCRENRARIARERLSRQSRRSPSS